MTAEHMASCQNKKPCAPEQQKQDSPHRDRVPPQYPRQYPLPQGTPPGDLGGGFTLSPTEVLDQRPIQNVPSRNPAPLLWAVTLPVHEVLKTPATTTNI